VQLWSHVQREDFQKTILEKHFALALGQEDVELAVGRDGAIENQMPFV
jgi:hypothetical protein